MSASETGPPSPSAYQTVREQLERQQYRWVITGVAGFIGSNLLQALLELGQRVIGVDNFLTGHHHNLGQVGEQVDAGAWHCFELIEGDIREPSVCQAAC